MALINGYLNNEVYAIVNDVHAQATGSKNVAVIDTQSFVDYGNTVLSSNDNSETFMNTLILQMARMYTTWRPYTSALKDLIVTGEEWGAIYQKIDAEVGDFVSDETYDLVDGQSVDQYVVRKPTAKQKLFVRRSPYKNYITIGRQQLKVAFRSEGDFAAFVAMVFGKMRIKLDFALENLARLAIANYIGTITAQGKTGLVFPLVTMYNKATGSSLTGGIDGTAAFNKDFMAYAAAEIELISKRLRNLSTSYNAEGAERHTPQGEQRFLVLDEFQTRLQHVVQYQAFHKELVSLREFVEVPYWQGEIARTTIKCTVDDGDGGTTDQTVENIIACVFDRYALGTFRSEEETDTTPYNASGRYYNTFHFAEQLWYNDLSENFVYFTLN